MTRAPWLERRGVALALTGVALAATAGALGLFEPTETRYALVARDLLGGGDWLVPRLAGLVHLDKPPLAYWAAALGMRAFGANAWGARLPVAVATLVALACTWRAARRLGVPPAASMWALASMALPFAAGRTLAADAFLAAAVAAFWALAPSAWASVALGLGALAKGPVVLVPTLLPVLAAAMASRSRAPLRRLGPAWAWPAATVLGLGWFAIVAARVPGALPWWFGHELWARATTGVHHRPGPAWYFVAVLAGGALPWLALLVAGLARAWRTRADERMRLLLAWLVVPLACFSCARSKLPAYLLPCFPAVAMLVALGVERAGRAPRVASAATLGVLAITGAIALPRVLALLLGAGDARAPLPPLVWAALAAFALAAAVVARGRFAPAAAIVVAAWVLLACGLVPYEAVLNSPRPLARLLAEQRRAGEPVVEVGRFVAGVPFELGEGVRLLDVARVRAFTPPADVARVFVARDSLAALAAAHGRVWLLAPSRDGAALADALGLAYTRVATWRNETLGFVTTP